MADAKITALTEDTVLDATDVLVVVDDVPTVPVTKKITVANFFTSPTIVTPTIVDFTNANHDHGDANDGGALVAGAIPAGLITNAMLDTTAGEVGGAWQTWTPTLSNITAGSSTTKYKYTQIGKTVHFIFRFTLGAGSAVGTNPSFTLPVAIHADYAPAGTQGVAPQHSAILIDNGTAEFDSVLERTAVANTVRFVSSSSPTAGNGAITAAAPFTWASGDTLWATGTYEAA